MIRLRVQCFVTYILLRLQLGRVKRLISTKPNPRSGWEFLTRTKPVDNLSSNGLSQVPMGYQIKKIILKSIKYKLYHEIRYKS